MTDTADSSNPQSHAGDADPKVSTRNPDTRPDDDAGAPAPVPEPGTKPDAAAPSEGSKRSTLREFAILAVIAVLLYYVMLTFVARPYLIPSESMEPTLHGCTGCVGDRIMVDKVSYRFGAPRPGDVIVFKGPAVVEPRLQVDPVQQHRAALGAERAVLRRLRPTGRERPGQKG